MQYFYLVFIIGVFVGSIVTQIIMHYKTGYGYFRLDPTEDSEDLGMHEVRICIPNGQNLLDKHRIILDRDPSQK